MKNCLAIAVFVFLAAGVSAQTGKPLKVAVIYDVTDASSTAASPFLIQLFAAQPKLFTVVNSDDKDLAIVANCYRATTSDPYSCFYVANESLGSNTSLLGAGIVVQKTVGDAATELFKSILQDVAERWNSTNRKILIGELETCLALTESSCAVPDSLVTELKTKSINLSQYMRKGGVKP